MPSASLTCAANGPIHDHWQHFSWAIIGPFVAIGSLFHEQQWAHSWISAASFLSRMGPFNDIAFLMRNNGPIQDHQHFLSFAPVGPFEVIHSFCLGNNGSIQGHRQLFSSATMGFANAFGVTFPSLTAAHP
jgi:hypothetical protein